jgi:hypothetical protein
VLIAVDSILFLGCRGSGDESEQQNRSEHPCSPASIPFRNAGLLAAVPF